MKYLSQVATSTIAVSTTTPSSQTGTPTQLPQTGFFVPFMLMCVLAGFLIYFGFREKVV
jgi:hypothetical protein